MTTVETITLALGFANLGVLLWLVVLLKRR